jgi:hypothetical protein
VSGRSSYASRDEGPGSRTQRLWESQSWYPRDKADEGEGDGDMPTFNVRYTDTPHASRVRFSKDDEGNDWKVCCCFVITIILWVIHRAVCVCACRRVYAYLNEYMHTRV